MEGWGLSPRGAGYLFGGDVVANVSFVSISSFFLPPAVCFFFSFFFSNLLLFIYLLFISSLVYPCKWS